MKNVLLSAALRLIALQTKCLFGVCVAVSSDQRDSSCLPDGAAEQDGVLQDDGESRAQRLQRQLGDVDVIDDDPP